MKNLLGVIGFAGFTMVLIGSGEPTGGSFTSVQLMIMLSGIIMLMLSVFGLNKMNDDTDDAITSIVDVAGGSAKIDGIEIPMSYTEYKNR